jgi:hypothetical protein
MNSYEGAVLYVDNRPVASQFGLASYFSGQHLLLDGGAPALGCAASVALRACCCLQHDAVFGGPLGKGPMDVRVSLEDSLSALVRK